MTTDNENTPNTEAEVTAELAKPEDVTAYVEERQEQEADALPPEDETEQLVRDIREKHGIGDEKKKASRYERLKRARDQYKAEAEELRSRLGQSSETQAAEQSDAYSTPESSEGDTARLESSLDSAKLLYGGAFDAAYQAFVEHCQRTGDKAAYDSVMNSGDVGQALVQWHDQMGNPAPSPEGYEAAMQQGRQQQEFQQHLAARDEKIRVQTEVKLRAEAFAATCSDFHEVMQSVEGVDDLPPVMLDLIRRSQVGPEIAYLMARDFWDADTKGLIDHAQSLANDPVAQARMVGNLEQAVMYSRGKGSAMQTRATKAPPPLSPVRGGSSPPRDLHALAKSDSAEDYIRARRGA